MRASSGRGRQLDANGLLIGGRDVLHLMWTTPGTQAFPANEAAEKRPTTGYLVLTAVVVHSDDWLGTLDKRDGRTPRPVASLLAARWRATRVVPAECHIKTVRFEH